MRTLIEIAKDYDTQKGKYLELYERYFAHLRGKLIDVLEIGVAAGGSLRMWDDYFGRARIWGIDNNPACAKLGAPGIGILIGSQADPRFLAALGEYNVIIDDGGHNMYEQMTTLTCLWPHVRSGGMYVIEDLHTSYWPGFGGGRAGCTTMEMLKGWIDGLNHEAITHKRAGQYRNSNTPDRGLRAMHFHESFCLLEKL